MADLEAIGPVHLTKIASARARARVQVYQQFDLRPDGFPWIKVNGRELTEITVLDLDASVVPARSDKDGAEPRPARPGRRSGVPDGARS